MVKIIMQNNQLDVRQLMTGKDGRLFVTVGDTQYFLAEIDTFQVSMNVTNTDVQPVGSILIYGVNTGVSFTLTFTEMVVRDDVLLAPMLAAIKNGKIPYYTFQGAAESPDGKEQRIVYRNCIPDSTIGIQSLTPGEVIKREHSYRINSVPEYLKALATRNMSA